MNLMERCEVSGSTSHIQKLFADVCAVRMKAFLLLFLFVFVFGICIRAID